MKVIEKYSGTFCGEAILILNVKPRVLECSNQGNYWHISDTILSVFFHFRTHSRCVVVVREVADREVVDREVEE